MIFLNRLQGEKHVYMQIVTLAMLVHAVYLIIFTAFSIKPLAIYNIFSVAFYAALLLIIRNEYYKFAVTAVHAEVALFVTVCAMFGGMSMGIGMYLLSMASLVYFCPFEHKRIPYFFAIAEALVYVALRIYSNLFMTSPALGISLAQSTFLHIFNACGSFLIILFAAFFTDSSNLLTKKRLKEENIALAKIANYDDLTGLESRSFFLERAETLPPTEGMTIAIGDIDDFKNINDTYGHVCGDYVLHTIAEIFRKSFSTDSVDICRWGGEEFVILFHDCPMSIAYGLLVSLIKQIADYPFTYKGTSFRVTMTFGIVSSFNKKFSLKTLDTADKLLYRGKQQGKNRVIK